jgi:hypothetical protein
MARDKFTSRLDFHPDKVAPRKAPISSEKHLASTFQSSFFLLHWVALSKHASARALRTFSAHPQREPGCSIRYHPHTHVCGYSESIIYSWGNDKWVYHR